MQPNDVADDQTAAVTDVQYLPDRALETDGGFGDVRHADQLAGRRSEAGLLQLVNAGRIVCAADVHGFGNRFADHIHRELAPVTDVGDSILQFAGSTPFNAQHQDRWVAAHQVEETERRSIDGPGSVDRRDQRNGPWNDGIDQ